MATKLKNMKLTSVDLVKAGANQKADICLYKSADSEDPTQEAPESPTEHEKNLFKRFLGWLNKNHADDEYEDDSHIEKADEPEAESEPATADLFKSAITESLQSIIEDETLSTEEKKAMVEKSIEQYHDAVVELAKYNPYHDTLDEEDNDDDGESEEQEPEPTEKSAPEPDYDEIEEVEVGKINHNHDRLGRFASANGGGTAVSGGGGSHTPKEPKQMKYKLKPKSGKGTSWYTDENIADTSNSYVKAYAEDGYETTIDIKNYDVIRNASATGAGGGTDPKRQSFLEATQRLNEKRRNPQPKFEPDFDNLDEIPNPYKTR